MDQKEVKKTTSLHFTHDKEDDEDGVGEQCGEVDHLVGRLDVLDEGEAHDDPGQKNANHQLPVNRYVSYETSL